MLSTRLISALVETQIRIWSTRFVLPLLRYKQVVQLTQPTARPTDGATSNSNAPGGQHELKSTRQCLGTSRALCGNAGSAAVRVGPTATAGGGSSTNFSASAGLTDDRELNSNAVTALCFAPTRRSLVCGDDTGKVTVWDLQVRPLPTHSSHLATHDVFVRLTPRASPYFGVSVSRSSTFSRPRYSATTQIRTTGVRCAGKRRTQPRAQRRTQPRA